MGDAAIGMTGMDIETAARNRIAILTIVFNNGVMGAERDVLKISDEKYGAMTVGGNYSKVAEGLNVASTRVEKPDHIVGAHQGGGRRDAKPARRSCSSSSSRKATTSRATISRDCKPRARALAGDVAVTCCVGTGVVPITSTHSPSSANLANGRAAPVPGLRPAED